MKKEHKYSEKKFKTFSLEKQQNILLQILKAIEKDYDKPTVYNSLKESYLSCLSYLKESAPYSVELKQIATVLSDRRRCSYLITDLRVKMQDRILEAELTVFTHDHEQTDNPELPIIVILDNLRSSFNVGSIFRTSECLKISKIYCCGITPQPDKKDIVSTSMGTSELVAWEHVPDTEALIKRLKEDGTPVYALETAEPSIDLYGFEPPSHLALVLGNEALGIAPETLMLCDGIIRIPVRGWKNSLNVAVSYAVTVYEIYRKLKENR